jgi:2-polyprenyl-3-methyl-5-hydroxy-6-metoxy-1,4-benzoquinol methylase
VLQSDTVTGEICGDLRLSAGDRLRYLWRNACRNLATLGRGPKTRAFRPDLQRADAAMSGQSPGRLQTELFIESELPELLPPRPVEVLEIGCGAGSMSYRLARLGYSGRYTGVDVQDRFRRDHPKDFGFEVEYHLIDAHVFVPPRPVELLFSNSTLEHVPNDRTLIERLPQFFAPGGIELQVVPSGSSLMSYLWHGYRQYTPASLAERFGEPVEIVRIGGFGSLLLHMVFITGPEMLLRRSLRKRAPGLYRACFRAALRIDCVLPFCPTAYAVIRRH